MYVQEHNPLLFFNPPFFLQKWAVLRNNFPYHVLFQNPWNQWETSEFHPSDSTPICWNLPKFKLGTKAGLRGICSTKKKKENQFRVLRPSFLKRTYYKVFSKLILMSIGSLAYFTYKPPYGLFFSCVQTNMNLSMSFRE